MFELSFLAKVIGKFMEINTFTNHGLLTKFECLQNCSGVLPIPSFLSYFEELQVNLDFRRYPVDIETRWFRRLREILDSYKRLKSLKLKDSVKKLHFFKGSYDHETKAWSWDNKIIDEK